ncbi:amidohydrolase family protein [Nonomuraea longicatena]|uniref:Amidohydrolase family protein n=2 Tax=Nonomuraea longicatena TaxID=83682 RepID=A0ABP4AIY2_9ACTN
MGMRYRLSRRRLLSLLPATAVAVSAASPDGEAPLAIRNVRIFDGRQITGHGTVLVAGGRILAVGDVPSSSRHRVYDGGGRTLLPGLIDCHVHSFEGSRADALRFGVTTELDMFGDPALLRAARGQRRSTAGTTQADLWSAGVGVTVPGGHPLHPTWKFPRVTEDTDLDRFVAARIAEGSDYVKVILEDGGPPPRPQLPTLTLEQVRRTVAAAHRHRRRAVVHAEKLALVLAAARAGADGFVHGFWDTEAGPAQIAELRRSGAFFVPTLSVVDWGVGARELLADERITPWLSPTQRHLLERQPEERPGRPDFLKIGSANVRRMHAAGVPILAGTDAPIRATANGVSMLAEVTHLARAGLSPSAALASATAVPARTFGLTDRGRIAPGLRADLILVDGDPTADPEALRSIAAVWKNGRLVDRTPPNQ